MANRTVPQLGSLTLALPNLLVGSDTAGALGKFTFQQLATFMSPYVAAVGSAGYVAVSGTVLPTPTGTNSYTLVGAGTYTRSGQANVVTTEAINILSWNGTLWALTTGIVIDLSKAGISPWTAKAYDTGSNVNYLGKDWISTALTTGADVPGTSLLWSNRLYAYTGLDTAITPNLYNSKVAVMGALGSQGQNVTSTTGTRSEYFPVVPGTVLKVLDSDYAVPVAATYNLHYYTSARLWISGGTIPLGVANEFNTVPANAAFARWFTNSLPATNVKVMIVPTTITPDGFIPAGYNFDPNNLSTPFSLSKELIDAPIRRSGLAIADALNRQSRVVGPQSMDWLIPSINLYDPNDPTIVKGAYISGAGAYVATGSPTQQVAFIPVKRNTTYSFFSLTTLTRVTPPISILNYTGAATNVQSTEYSATGYYTTTDRAQTLRITTPLDAIYYMVVEGTAAPSSFVKFGYSFGEKIDGAGASSVPWNGKVTSFFGDSFTVQGLFIPTFLGKTGMSKAIQDGQNGGAFKAFAKSSTLAADIASSDVAVVMGGTNNYGVAGGGTVGTVNSPMDDTTVHGQIKGIVDRLKTAKPGIQIMFFTCVNRGVYSGSGNGYTPNSDGLTIKIVAEATIDECRNLGIPCYDLLSNSGFNNYTLSLYTSDNLHPNNAGGAMLGKLMGNFANTLVPFGSLT